MDLASDRNARARGRVQRVVGTTLLAKSIPAGYPSARFCSTPVRGISYTQARTHTAAMQEATEFLDKKFVYAACAIGAAYALIISGLGFLLGKEAAGVAGVALTAL